MASSNSNNIPPSKNVQVCKEDQCTSHNQHDASNTVTSNPINSKTDNEKPASSTRLYELDLDAKEIDKLFEILYEPDIKVFSDVFGHEREHITYKPLRRFAPYPVHQQLYMQQQQEQERRRQSLLPSASGRSTLLSRNYHDMFRLRERIAYSDMFRSKIVKTVLAFIDKHSDRIISTQNDCSEKCVVCMCNYQANQALRELRCNHKFHRKCIDEWLVKSYICPVCRTDLTGTGKIFHRLTVLYHIWKEEASKVEQDSIGELNQKDNSKPESSNSESSSCRNKDCSCNEQTECLQLISEVIPENSDS